MAFKDVAADFIGSPNPATAAAVRLAVQACPSYTPTPTFFPEAMRLAEAGRHRDVIELVASWMPGAFLSPSAHSLLATSLAAVGDVEAAELERDLARLAALAILRSGDGTRGNPWVVLRVDDEYDLLRWTDRRPEEQRVIADGRGKLDVIQCADGSEAWFQLFRDGKPAEVAA